MIPSQVVTFILFLVHYAPLAILGFGKIIEIWVTHPISTNTIFGTLL